VLALQHPISDDSYKCSTQSGRRQFLVIHHHPKSNMRNSSRMLVIVGAMIESYLNS
jgi:hypothetical protein